jgi:hypothetical protein
MEVIAIISAVQEWLIYLVWSSGLKRISHGPGETHETYSGEP